MNSLPALQTHSLALSFASARRGGPKELHHASAALLWVDRPFAVTAAHVLQDFMARMRNDETARLWLGKLALDDVADRVLCQSLRHDLATLRVEPEELAELGDDVCFHNPAKWPPEPVQAGEVISVFGFPRDQWPAQIRYRFRVESAQERRFSAVLERSDMPGRLEGLCGAPAFRSGPNPEFVGVVTEALFHNEMVRCQHARHVDTCGQVPGEA